MLPEGSLRYRRSGSRNCQTPTYYDRKSNVNYDSSLNARIKMQAIDL